VIEEIHLASLLQHSITVEETMHDKKILALSVLAMVMVIIGFAFPAQAEDPPGKKIFLTNKCNTCHSIESQGIEKTMKSAKGPDLSAVGAEHNAEWLTKYINKEETKNDKKHVKGWTGSKEDLQTLVKWLETLKTAPKK
jgi:cytochrome c2